MQHPIEGVFSVEEWQQWQSFVVWALTDHEGRSTAGVAKVKQVPLFMHASSVMGMLYTLE